MYYEIKNIFEVGASKLKQQRKIKIENNHIQAFQIRIIIIMISIFEVDNVPIQTMKIQTVLFVIFSGGSYTH